MLRKENAQMQGAPRHDEALQGLNAYEHMVNAFAENAKAYWRLWGALVNRGLQISYRLIVTRYVQGEACILTSINSLRCRE